MQGALTELDAEDMVQRKATGNTEILEAAFDYLRRGWSVVPIRPRSKLPLVAWEEYQHQLAGEGEVAGWFSHWPDANVGIVTGALSRLAVLDIDPRHGGTEALAALEQKNGPLPATVEAQTGGGGRHLYFKPSNPLRSRAGLAAGIDIRAEGGLVVAPPSIHPSGKRYAWRTGHDPALLVAAPLPEWLERLASAPEGRGQPVRYWRELLRAGVEEGVRNNTIASLAGHLLWRGVDPEVAIELLLCWNRVRCRPPLEDEEVARVVSSITRLHRRDERP